MTPMNHDDSPDSCEPVVITLRALIDTHDFDAGMDEESVRQPRSLNGLASLFSRGPL